MRNVINTLKKLYLNFSVKGWNGYKNSFEEEKTYLDQLPEPKTDIERAYNQYLCQKKCEKSLKFFFLNLVSFMVLIPVIIKYRCNKIIYDENNKVDAVFTQDFEQDGTLPAELQQKINKHVICDYDRGSLSGEDLKYIFDIWQKYPFSFYFWLKNVCRIACYSYAIRKFSPQYIIASAEYSFSSSLLTNYCEKHGISHINIMHGEKVFFIRDAFSRFHFFYIWDEFYKKLFMKLRADKTRYIVSIPLEFMTNGSRDKSNKVIYYLQMHTEVQLREIKKNLDALGSDFLVRPHPVHHYKEIDKVFAQEEIEDERKIPLSDSLEKAELVISTYSTVLLQAHWLGIPVVIDDVSNPKLYYELKKRSYIMFEKQHKLLSELLIGEI